MAEYGLFLSSEELGPRALIDAARYAETVGINSVLLSDHFHPWLESQGESPFVWSVLGAIAATTELQLTTGVTCPTVRIHPAIVAQAAATVQTIAGGRFRLGVGTGENLNEHILGHGWPPAETRLQMLEESIAIMRALWAGDYLTHHGHHFTVENARIFSLPDSPPPILVSGFGPIATALAARVGEGYVNVTPEPELPSQYREQGGEGPTLGAMKVCWMDDEASARKLAHDRWRTTCLPGPLNQELPMPSHFEAAAEVVTEEQVAAVIPCGPDPQVHLQAVQRYVDAGYDEIFIAQIGDDQRGFLDFFTRELRPLLP